MAEITAADEPHARDTAMGCSAGAPDPLSVVYGVSCLRSVSYAAKLMARLGATPMRVGGKPRYRPRTPSSRTMVASAWKMPLYCMTVVCAARRVRTRSSGYVSVQATMPAEPPATSLRVTSQPSPPPPIKPLFCILSAPSSCAWALHEHGRTSRCRTS